jgi:hypothetical protein
MILTWIITIITFFLGYGLAVWVRTPTEQQRKVIQQTLDNFRTKPKIGMVKPLSPEELALRKDKSKLAEDKIMSDTFDSILDE